MKRKNFLTILVFYLCLGFFFTPSLSEAITTYNCNGLTGGATRNLDSISVSVLSNLDRSITHDSEKILFFYFDSSGTEEENTSTHPYIIRPDDYSVSGVWKEILTDNDHAQNTDTGTTQTSFQIDSGGDPVKVATTTTYEAISKTIGSGGDYATFALAIAALPDMQSHNITLTIKAGTTLTETCTIQNRHASGNVSFTVQAEKYFPTSGELPTADSATATTLVDAALTGQSDDYYNGCWILIVDGTGTDNGFVPITDYVDATGTCTVASWPGTQPDNTSRYLIVGALVDCAGSRDYGFDIQNSTAPVYLTGIGIDDADVIGILLSQVSDSIIKYCGAYNADRSGLYVDRCMRVSTQYCGMVNNNTDNSSLYGGVVNSSSNQMLVYDSALSDNRQFGARVQKGGYLEISNCFGDNNGTWGTYAKYSGQAYCPGTECSGSSGDHSNAAGDGSLAY